MKSFLLVAVGGGIGAMLRYGIGLGMKSLLPAYASSGTLVVNVVGCLVIGYVMGATHELKSVSESTRLFFVVGVLGGLTTFSSLAHETVYLTNSPDAGFTVGLGHLSANVLFGLAAVWLGAWLGREATLS